MTRCAAILGGLLTVCLLASGTWAESTSSAQGGKIRVLLTYGGHGFEEKPFFEMFDNMEGIEYKAIKLPDQADMLNPKAADEFDVIVMYDMVPAISEKQQEAFVALLKKGIGVVSLHHNMGAHRNWDEFRKIIGGKFILEDCVIDGQEYKKSGWAHGQDYKVIIADPNHPITRGLKDFIIHDETYKDYYTAPNVHVILKTDCPTNDPEIGWVTKYGESRVFYLMLGHDSLAWKNPNYPVILKRGIEWAAGRLQ
ncbi:MAG: ThuA domain-containing protein [Thermogutta sp.]|nr:ThuA domain-containing protein [Thermogutta sp.]HPU07143.1 ThuA domain-containing protein [Thermogutta sp.]HPZ84421.1 ThuA domain-containing protein [Thermogutta sp.]HQF13909.1 ThuA domain-containing protein [Thermogutta sp.]